MDELRLDGNAAAGVLAEAFVFEMTTAEYACDGCGKIGTLGSAIVYDVRGMGVVVRCPGCDRALIRLSHAGGRRLMDFRGMRHLKAG